MGIAILSGVMASLRSTQGVVGARNGTPARLPGKFVACDARPEAAQAVHAALDHYGFPLTTLTNENVAGAEAADIVLLACKPNGFRDILKAKGMRDALADKLLVSILAGVNTPQIEDCLYQHEGPHVARVTPPSDACRIVRVMPNTAAFVGQSMTVIAQPARPLSPHHDALVAWIFGSIGKTVKLPASAMDASTALCGSGPAFCALMLEALADGAVAMGLPRAEAQMMAAQTMRGTADLVSNGDHPAVLRDKVSTPGGCTIGGLLVLEEGTVRGHVARAVREAAVVAGQLGQGVQGVNGTRK